jgi:selenocysteine lyase/cysteine desulfurase
VKDDGQLDPADLTRLLDDRVRLVCFPHCSNILGALNPVAAWCALVHEAGAVACVDGVSAAPHGLPDIPALGADIYLFSTYKTYGPHQGIMLIEPDLAMRLPNQAHYFNAGASTARLTPAGPDHAQIAACAGIADYIDALAAHHGIEGDAQARGRAVAGLQRAQEAGLLAPLIDYLRGRNDLRLLGPAGGAAKVGTVAVATQAPAGQVEAALVPHGIQASGCEFYAPRLLEALGIDPAHGALRMSFTHYTSEAEIISLIAALDQVL